MEEGEEIEESIKAAIQKGYKVEQILRLAKNLLVSAGKEEVEEALYNLGIEGFSQILQCPSSSWPISTTPIDLQDLNSKIEEKSKQLTPSQKKAFDDIQSGLESGKRKLITVIGPGGTGKSFLISLINDICLKLSIKVKITATSASAAKLINGTTIHSLFALSPNMDCRLEFGTSRWGELQSTSLIVIDEISMLSERLLRKIDELLRKVSQNPTPFGGKTLLFFGDLLQLPPVIPKGSQDQPAFLCSLFKMFTMFELTEACRQREDEEFAQTLNRVRKGYQNQSDELLLLSRVCGKGHPLSESCKPSADMVTLCAHREDVDLANAAELASLPADLVEVRAKDSRLVERDELIFLDKRDLLPERFFLKIGSRIMLIRNVQVSEGLTNGTRGTLLEIQENFLRINVDGHGEALIPKFRQKVSPPGHVPFSRTQFPVALAWALTIHKAQGMTIPKARIVMKNLFSEGQAYVALSRVERRENLHLTEFHSKSIIVDQKALALIERMKK